VRCQFEACGSSISTTLEPLSFNKDTKLMWKATEMPVNLFEYLSCTDSSAIKRGCSKTLVPGEMKLCWRLMCKKCVRSQLLPIAAESSSCSNSVLTSRRHGQQYRL
jgi:hypothetical protein